MPTWKLTLEYDGTRYRGWQAQANTERTVQGVLLRAAREVVGADAVAGGAGRTDAGVHALAQVAHLKARSSLPPVEIRHGLNDTIFRFQTKTQRVGEFSDLMEAIPQAFKAIWGR